MAGITEWVRTSWEMAHLIKFSKEQLPAETEQDSIGFSLQRTAEQHGHRPAVTFEGRTITWGEINTEANRVANYLLAQGLNRGDSVALLMENRLEFLLVFFGVAKAGGILAPLNTNLRGLPLAHCIQSAMAKKLIFGQELAAAAEEIHGDIDLSAGRDFLWMADPALAIDSSPHAPDWAMDLAPLLEESPADNPAISAKIQRKEWGLYLFTSGTTGLPKAAIVTHHRYLNTYFAVAKLSLRMKGSDRLYLCLPLYHGAGLMTCVGAALGTGASIFLRRKFSASDFLSDVREQRTTVFFYIGELCRYLLAQPAHADDAKSPLRKVFGNGLRPDIWMQFKRRFGVVRVAEFYGASEGNAAFFNALNKDCTIGTTTQELKLIRYDIENDEIVLDDKGRCIEVAECEAGLMVAKIQEGATFEGYTNAEASESKILRNAFEDGDAWFNSGDLLRTVDVGVSFGLTHYQFVDRIGDTFRWKGENCSTNEVAELINRHPQIQMANVYGVEIAGTDGRAGMAAILTEEGVTLDMTALSAHIVEALPGYARPVFLRLLPGMDVTGTFKLVKGELREQAFHPQQCPDPVYVMRPGSDHYELLDAGFYSLLQHGKAGY